MAAVLVALALTGCWSRREINELALVLAAGFDRAPGGDIRVTAQFPVPQPAGGDRGGTRFFTASATGSTLELATNRLTEQVANYVTWKHLQLVVLGRDLAAGGVSEVVDFLYRPVFARETARVVVARGEAGPLLEGVSRQAALPVRGLREVLVNAEVEGLAEDLDLARFATRLLEPGWDPVAPVVRIDGVGGLLIEGLAAFQGDRLAGFLSGRAPQGYLLSCRRCQRMVVPLQCPGGTGIGSIYVYGHQASVDVEVAGGRVERARLHVRLTGVPSQTFCRGRATDAAFVRTIEQTAREVLRSDVESALAQARAMGADIFGFGLAARRRGATGLRHQDWVNWPVQTDIELTLDREAQTVEPTRPGSEDQGGGR